MGITSIAVLLAGVMFVMFTAAVIIFIVFLKNQEKNRNKD
ncbi:hypothetical protein J2S14_000542 [Lederbergia wuyishanensis]|uniref:Oxaloacetate decarboxylase n=1 Tax=Lederbergia wuyishanensis TaxID=1347903 RepID=A0ABU0D045_9BACI|nr:hypothetical protein [Lederbergia wuyishanensis]